MFLKYFVIAVPILMVAFFNPLISFLSIYTYCTSEMLPITKLTIIHNFGIRRDDGTTPAQRLFAQSFPDLFEWVVPRMGELPRPRRTLKSPKSKKPTP